MTTKSIVAITVGNELLNGSVADADLAILGRLLGEAGLELARAYTVGDDPAEILEALGAACRSADALLVTGGLGSTGDDLTRETAASFFGLGLAENPALRGWLLHCWREFHPDLKPPRRYFRQALVPDGARTMSNSVGSAPGLAFAARIGGRVIDVFLLPGPPHELEPMVRAELIPRLTGAVGAPAVIGFLAPGMGELELENRVGALPLPTGIVPAYCAVPEGTKLFLRGGDPQPLRETLARCRGLCDLPPAPDGCFELAEALIPELRRRGLSLAVAESCTGGGLGAAITAVPGASDVFMGGIIAYDNRIKRELLRVPPEVLDGPGAVSAPCAEAMARGAAEVLGVPAAISVTGVAGPGGGTPEKPVGLVWIGTVLNGVVRVQSHRFRGDREAVRRQTRGKALLQLYRMLMNP